jgi:hypothetical protein
MSWDGTAAMVRVRRVGIFVRLCGWLLGLLVCGLGSAGASSEPFPYEDAVTYCRGNVPRPAALNDDRSILCYDGDILSYRDFSLLKRLKDNGLFVVRSRGGFLSEALHAGRLLRERNPIVVVYDYCFSGCASFLLIATDRAVVRKNTIVAWHYGTGATPDCPEMKSYVSDELKTLQIYPCASVPWDLLMHYWEFEPLSREFYAERTRQPQIFGHGFDVPQSYYVTSLLKGLLAKTGRIPRVAWTWNPRFSKSVLKSKVSYEAYPENQAEVDELAARFGLGRVIFDP